MGPGDDEEAANRVIRWIGPMLAALTWGGSWAMSCEDLGDTESVAAVKDRRAGFNQAIQQRDLVGVGSVLHEDVILVSGSDSEVYRGREAQLEIWGRLFADEASPRYVRTPDCIRVSPRFPVALEFGHWRGEAPDGSYAAGTYSAKWRRLAVGWVLESETYSTEACGGSFCPEQG